MTIIFVIYIFLLTPAAPNACTDCTDGSGGADCCTESNPCGAGEGDCDKDSQCIGNLRCGVDNCDTSLAFTGTYDCCYWHYDF